jgi:DNA-3-methyladenine glycosylase
MESLSVSWLKRELDLKKVPGISFSSDFYERSTLEVAQDLLGKVLWVRSHPEFAFDDPRAGVTAGRIVETEAYFGEDPASHSARGETPRASIMFGQPGVAYVYFIYGMYEMLNFVTEPQGRPGAVLIRAVEPFLGHGLMAERRNCGRERDRPLRSNRDLCNGPGKLCRAMGIKMAHNGQSLAGPIFLVCDDGYRPQPVSVSGRVGIRKAVERPWRFFITGHPDVSKVPQNRESRILNLSTS